mmetsp:Transcript_2659/g.3119  ORF Transcript_2659/g.3119 Transcript_2659/m.3119 type:complete len:451 (+) Transcript_2659:285-1637(+)
MFTPKEAVAQSNFIIFFGCVTRYLKNFKNKHPLKDSTAIDYGIVTCMLPLVMLGTFIGVQVNELLPETLVFGLLFITLIYLTYKAILKAFATYKKEKKETEAKKNIRRDTYAVNDSNMLSAVDSREDMFRPLVVNNESSEIATISGKNGAPALIPSKSGSLRRSVRNTSRESMAKGEVIDRDTEGMDEEDKNNLFGERKSTYANSEINETLQQHLNNEKSHFRPRTLVVVSVPFFSILIIGLLRGTKSLKSIIGISRCDPFDFVFFFLQVAILLVLAIANIVLLKKEYNSKIGCGYQFVKGDIVWNTPSITKFSIFAMIAGFISGAVGLSGGILFTPLFLDFGIAPSVASGTSMYMAMFATLSSSILFIFGGFIIYDFAFWLAFFAIIGTAAGITVIGNAVKKSGKSSILVFLLAFVILVSCVGEGATGVLDTIKKINDHENLWKFHSYC